MDLINILIAAIRFRAGYVKNFAKRVAALTAERMALARKLERTQKSLKDLRDRKKGIYPYLRRLPRDSEAHAQSLGGLMEIKKRIEEKKVEEQECFDAVDLNARLLGFAEKSLATSERKLEDAEADLAEHRAKIEADRKAAEAARLKAEADAEAEAIRLKEEAEAKRIADEKAARKAVKHAANRAKHRAEKEARRMKPSEFLSDRIDATRRDDDFVIPAEALVLAEELGADVRNPADREIVLSLFSESQA